MTIYQSACGYIGPFEEAQAGYGAQVTQMGGIGSLGFPSASAFVCDDSASGAVTTFDPALMRGATAGTVGWPIFLVYIYQAMNTTTAWNCMRTSNQATNRPGTITISRSAGGVYNFNIADGDGTVKATGSTALSISTLYTCKVLVDDSGANRIMTLYLWDGSAWVQEVTYTGGGVGATPFPVGFGHSRTKGSAASGGIFYVGNIYVPTNNGSQENTDPTKPRYGLGMFAMTGASTYDEWPGNYADVDDAPTNDADTTYDESGTGTGLERQTYMMSNPTIPASSDIVFVSSHSAARVVSGTGGAYNAIFTDGASDAFGQDETGLGGSYSQVSYGRELAPDGTAWGATSLAALQLGWRRQAAASDPRNLRLTAIHGLVWYKAQDAAAGGTRSQTCVI